MNCQGSTVALLACSLPRSSFTLVALFRVVGVPWRLALLIEIETLFNDGTAMIVFNLGDCADLREL